MQRVLVISCSPETVCVDCDVAKANSPQVVLPTELRKKSETLVKQTPEELREQLSAKDDAS